MELYVCQLVQFWLSSLNLIWSGVVVGVSVNVTFSVSVKIASLLIFMVQVAFNCSSKSSSHGVGV